MYVIQFPNEKNYKIENRGKEEAQEYYEKGYISKSEYRFLSNVYVMFPGNYLTAKFQNALAFETYVEAEHIRKSLCKIKDVSQDNWIVKVRLVNGSFVLDPLYGNNKRKLANYIRYGHEKAVTEFMGVVWQSCTQQNIKTFEGVCDVMCTINNSHAHYRFILSRAFTTFAASLLMAQLTFNQLVQEPDIEVSSLQVTRKNWEKYFSFPWLNP